jgi:hypothetical protein
MKLCQTATHFIINQKIWPGESGPRVRRSVPAAWAGAFIYSVEADDRKPKMQRCLAQLHTLFLQTKIPKN